MWKSVDTCNIDLREDTDELVVWKLVGIDALSRKPH